MHKLVRSGGPHCLTRYQHGLHQWSLESPTPEEREHIWECLRLMQDTRCAYCEADISKSGRRHLEHFRQRDRFPQGTFDWNNLFGSCNREDACGKFKDSCGAYDHAVLLKPDNDNPDDYFIFISDGTITPREDLNQHNLHRALETLRVFNLDAEHGALREMRREAVRGFLDTATALQEMYEENPDSEELQQYLAEELLATAHLPFATAIRHTLSWSF
ncbi:hypothetical protein D3C76_658010 [compost metagenome]|jgi:uncharacterized protein (TIGR02646 family)|uniref:retron Ec78 anti-phage system effector HNH endonuclease PtuB n=1 Tax=Pseudomonas TaxID=286 RepID=UPI000FBF4571|nr:retron Ec78 anti-phage system effector HNH endonuclease PtuB [Pseudomonas fluorescens]VVP56382.1 hypothetical protein PS843_05662 [Pseudomonas fluorescens]